MMKLPPLKLLRCIFGSSPSIITSDILNLISTVNPMEPALEKVVPFLSRQTITSVLQENQNPLLTFRFFIWAARRKKFRSGVSHNLIVDMLLADTGGIDLYWKNLEELNSYGVSISSNAFYVLIDAYWKMGKAELAVQSFGRMNDFNCKPDLYTYNKILHIMVQKDVILLALAVYNLMLKSNHSPSSSTFSTLIDGLCKSGNTKDALKLFDEMSMRGIMPDKVTYTVVICGLCRAARTDDAYRLYNTMKSSGCSPDSFTYVSLLNGFSKVGRIDEAIALLKSFVKDGYVLDLNGYSCLIDGLVRAQRFSEAHDLFKRLPENNITPDIVLYTIMIRGLSEAGRVKDALKLLKDMTERGVMPDSQCYNTLIKGFCDMGFLDQAQSLQLEISKTDQFLNSCTYTILICGMCRKGLVEEAHNLFNDMEKLGCRPSVVTFNALIDGLCKARKLEEANLLFYKMEIGRNPSLFLRLSQGPDRILDSASLHALVAKLCESGKILKAYRLLMQLADSGGVMPDIWTYNILINGFCKSKDINSALKLFKDLQLKGHSPDSVTYGTLIDGLQRVDREEDSLALLEQMINNGCTPTSAVYKALMTWSCRKRKVSAAFSLWLKYLRSLPDRKEEEIKLVEEHLEKQKFEEVVRLLIDMDFKLLNFDLAPYTIWIIGFCQLHKPNEALKIVSILEERGVNLSPPGCVMLINSLNREGNLDEAVKVFIYSMEKGYLLASRICNQLLKSLLRDQKKSKHAFDLMDRMKSVGYDLDTHIHQKTKFMSAIRWDMQKAEIVSPRAVQVDAGCSPIDFPLSH